MMLRKLLGNVQHVSPKILNKYTRYDIQSRKGTILNTINMLAKIYIFLIKPSTTFQRSIHTQMTLTMLSGMLLRNA